MRNLLSPLLLMLPIAALAAGTPDESFYKNAAEGGMAEVDAGNLAQQKSTDPKIRDFGAMMVKDHSAANEKLEGIAASKDIKLPANPSAGQLASKTKLEMLSGDSFDKSYVKGQIRAHRDTVTLFQKEIATGKDPEAKAFAISTLPTIESHLKAIEAIADSKGIAH